MFLPILLIAGAIFSAAIVAYGTQPGWVVYDRGLELILASRRMQWPLLVLSLVLCVALIGMVISGRRRAWWLIGLAPVLALFVHKFVNDPYGQLLILDQPAFATVEEAAAASVRDDEPVVGLQFGGNSFAYATAALNRAPVVMHAVHDKHLIVLWSAAANRATAASIERTVKARDFEIVSVPAGATLVYDGRLGQFINALTGQTPQGKKPVGFTAPIATVRTTWKRWRVAHPETSLLATTPASGNVRPLPSLILPPPTTITPADTRVTIVAARHPIAVLPPQITTAPLNIRVGEVAVLVFRDPQTGEVRAFDRRVEEDLIPTFRTNTDPKRKGAAFYDPDTGSGWNLSGETVSGKKEFKGRRLAPLIVEEDVPWGVMKYWYPDLTLVEPGGK